MSDNQAAVEAANKALGASITLLQGFLGASMTARIIDEHRKRLVATGAAPSEEDIRDSLAAVVANSERIQNS